MKPRAKQPGARRKRTNHRRMPVIGLAFICLLETGFLVPVIAQAQESRRIPKLGYLWAGSGYSNRSAFHQELRELGYVEGKNILIEHRVAEANYDRLNDLAAELVRLQVDVIFANSTLSARSAKEATQTIPIVMYSGDPVGEKLVASLARPGGNITGVTNLSRELSMKRLELLKEIVSRAVLVAVLWDPNGPVPLKAFRDTELAAQTLSIKILSLQVRSPEPDLKGAFETASKNNAGALIVISNPLTISNRKQIVELANVNRLPAMYPAGPWVDQGGLISYGPTEGDLYRRAAIYVDKILKGAKPAELPVEQPKRFAFLINLKTAKQIGLAIPPNVLARADRVIR